uniref:rho GTPase-activating protein 33-like n=1 Tax=Pristiophorus japonicus TaxID=55135 RepID=UPI00398E87F7
MWSLRSRLCNDWTPGPRGQLWDDWTRGDEWTLQCLLRHLASLAQHSPVTSMHVKNLAIVWAPNLLRSKEIESVGFTGTDAFREVRIQSVVVEFLLSHVDILFSDKFSSVGKDSTGHSHILRPKSILVPSPSSRLLTLEEAQARTLAQGGEEMAPVYERFHSINMPADRRRNVIKMRKTGGGSWKTFFTLGKVPGSSRRKSQPETGGLFNITETDAGSRVETVTLRSARSEESLSSQHSGTGASRLRDLRRRRSSGDAVSVSGDPRSLAKFQPQSPPGSEDQEDIYVLPEAAPCPLPPPPPPPHAPDRASKPVSFTRPPPPSALTPPSGGASLDVSQPLAVTVPAKVLDMLGSRAGEPQASACSGGRTISLLLADCHFLPEGPRKLAAGEPQLKGQADGPGPQDQPRSQNALCPPSYQTMAALSASATRHVPPPPPPKNPARLMALALTERAHQATRQSTNPWEEHWSPEPAPVAAPYAQPEPEPAAPHLHSPLYSTVDPLRRTSPRDLSPSDNEIGPGNRLDKLAAQGSALPTSPGTPPDAYPEAGVKLTQSLRRLIAHCHVQRSAHPSPAPAPPTRPHHHPHRSVPRCEPQNPLHGQPSAAEASSPLRSRCGRQLARCLSVSAEPALPPLPPPPPPKPPHLLRTSTCRCGTMPGNAQLKPAAPQRRPPAPIARDPAAETLPDPPSLRPQSWATRWPSASAQAPSVQADELYAEILPELPSSAPVLLYHPAAPHNMVSTAYRLLSALPPDPPLPGRPHAARDQPGFHAALPDPPPGLRRPRLRRQPSDATYVNVPGSAGASDVQPPRCAPPCPDPDPWRAQEAEREPEREPEDARLAEMAQPRGRSDRADTGRQPAGPAGRRPQPQADCRILSDRRWAPQGPHGHWTPMAGSGAPMVYEPHGGAHSCGQSCGRCPPGEGAWDPYRPLLLPPPPPPTYASFLPEPEYQEVMVTFEEGPQLPAPLLLRRVLAEGMGGRSGSGRRGQAQPRPCGPPPRPHTEHRCFGPAPHEPLRRASTHRQHAVPAHWAAQAEATERSFC